MNDIADYRWLVGSEARKWLDDVSHREEPAHRLLDRLRKTLTAGRARLVVGQLELRKKAFEKFGDLAGGMFFTDLSLQQATDRWIAAYKAQRFDSSEPVADYCCGMGGDLLALAGRTPTTGWDRSAEMAILAEANAWAWGVSKTAEVCVGSVENHPPAPEQHWHLDPDRRTDGRRSTHKDWHSPNEATIRSWLDTAPNAAIKLAPAAVLDEEWQGRAELEWISRDRQCRQLVAWFGSLARAPNQRRATAVYGDEAYSFAGEHRVTKEVANEIGGYVFDTDPAIRAAKLTSALATSLGCAALSLGESYLTADRTLEHPLITGFRVTEVLPLRLGDLVKHLKTCNIGTLEIKTRSVATNPQMVRSKLKLSGTRPVTLLLTKLAQKEIAILAERLGHTCRTS